MSSTSKRPPLPPAKRRKTTTTAAIADTPLSQNQNPNPNPHSSSSAGGISAPPITLSQEDVVLSRSKHLTRPEVLRRRSHNLKQLIKVYRYYYWALMEELKCQARVYYWKYGSPFEEDREQEPTTERENGVNEILTEGNNGENNNNSKGGVHNLNYQRCLYGGCKSKAMALTNFCHPHILSDPKQKLYKPCEHVTWSAKGGSRICGKPILRSTVPSLCLVHYQKTQKDVAKALRKGGVNIPLSIKVAPNFHLVVAEYVREIQAKRIEVRDKGKIAVKEEPAS